MAGKREAFERTLFRDGNRASTMLEQDAGGSTHRVSNSGNVPTEAIKDTTITSVTRRLKNEEISNNPMHLSSTRMQENVDDPGINHHMSTNQISAQRSVVVQNSQGHHRESPGRDQNQNITVTPVPQDLPGIVPPREISTFPSNGDVSVGPANFRRMAVCQETDDAICQRTKMRVYMKRF